MALKGTYKVFTYTNHPTDTVVQTITYPQEMLEDDPDYDKRGTSEEITVPEIVETVTLHENVFVAVQGTSISVLVNTPDIKSVDLSSVYRVYSSEEAAKENWDDYLFENNVFGNWDWNENTNPWEVVYTAIKAAPEGELLIDC